MRQILPAILNLFVDFSLILVKSEQLSLEGWFSRSTFLTRLAISEHL